MSDLAAAAAAMGVPESIVERSAEARAQETGSSVEEILAAWAGGDGAPAAVPAAAVPPTESAPIAEPESEPEAEPEVSIVIPTAEPAEAPVTAPVASGAPPVLIGASDNPMTIMIGAVALFAVIFLVGLIGPSVQADTPGARTSEIALSAAAEDGMEIYSSLGCAACHTQMVRPVIADVGLGGVTLNDANQPLGTRRFGPDLSDIGSRTSGSQIEAIISGFGDHPAAGLSGDDMNSLVSYLLESSTSEASE